MWLGDAKIFGWQVKVYKCECVHRLPFACQMNFGQLHSDVTLSSPSPPEKEGAQPARLGLQKGRLKRKNETRRWEGMRGRLGQSSGFPAEKAMVTLSSTLAWKIPWMEGPGRLQSMGSLGVGYYWATSLSLFTFMHWRRKWQPTPVFLPGESQGRGAWWAAVYGVVQSRIRLKRLSSSSSSSRLPRRCSGKEFACWCRRHERLRFNLCIRKIPWSGKWQPLASPLWTEDSDGLQSLESQTVRHNWGIEHSTAQREHGQERGRRKRQSTEVLFKEIEEAPWWLESWVPGRNWGEREESRWVKRIMAWIDFKATTGKLKLLLPLPWSLGVRLNTNGQWFNQPCLCNQASIKPKVTGFGEFPGW